MATIHRPAQQLTANLWVVRVSGGTLLGTDLIVRGRTSKRAIEAAEDLCQRLEAPKRDSG